MSASVGNIGLAMVLLIFTSNQPSMPMLKQTLHAVYDHIDKTSQYETVLGTSHLQDFTAYLIQHDRITTLVVAAVKRSRTLQAIQLVQQYKKQYAAFAERVAEEGLGEEEMLLAYLHMKGVYDDVEDFLPHPDPPQEEEEEEEDSRSAFDASCDISGSPLSFTA